MELFDDLYNQHQSNKKRLTDEQKSSVVNYIKTNKNMHDNIYKIIKLYELQQKDTNLYKAKILKTGGVRINLENLPQPLQQMIYSFCHKKTFQFL